MKDIILILSKGIITGILSGYLLMYGLRPAVPYPDFILEPFEHKWMFIILFLINYYAFLWDITISVLMFLCVLALLFDMHVFTINGFRKKHTIVNKYDKNFFNNKPVFKSSDKNDKEKNYNTSIIDELKKIKNSQSELTFNPGDPSPFI